MPSVFSTRPGYALAIRDNHVPVAFSLGGWSAGGPCGGFITRRAIILGVQGEAHGNYQIIHTLRGFIYAFVFGDRVGRMNINGVMFTGICQPGGGPDSETGFNRVLEYYGANRIFQREKPIGVQIGAATFRAFLTDITMNVVDPQTGMGAFTMSFFTAPDQEAGAADIEISNLENGEEPEPAPTPEPPAITGTGDPSPSEADRVLAGGAFF